MRPSPNTKLQLLNPLTLLQTKQRLEDLKAYKEFCYQFYLLDTHVELIDETCTASTSLTPSTKALTTVTSIQVTPYILHN